MGRLRKPLPFPWPIPDFQQDGAPDTWHCAYCDRANHGDRLTCVGCQAGRPQEAEDAGLEIRVFGDETIVIHEARSVEAIHERWEEKYRGFQNGDRITVLDSRGLR